MSETSAWVEAMERQAELDDQSDGIARADRTMPSTMQGLGDAMRLAFGNLLEGKDESAVELKFAATPDREIMNLDTALARYRARLPAEDADRLCEIARDSYIVAAKLAESPIERDLLPWLITADWPSANASFVTVVLPDENFEDHAGLLLVPQFVAGPFRLDFAICRRIGGKTHIVAVECDGFQFHDVGKDRRRDWILKAAGVETVRATGREIKDRPDLVVDRVRRVVAGWGVSP